ncbi:MAG: von Willebrand factor type A domain-containing protein [Chitinophagaceae bacterium]
MRGEVKDEAGNVLQNVTILQQKTGYIYHTGFSGTFGIVAYQRTDTLQFSMQGYFTQKVFVDADKYVRVKMKQLPASAANSKRVKLSSLTKNLEREDQKEWYNGSETYASLLENHFIKTAKFPNTGMALNVDRASYSNIRRFINLKSLVPPDAVRIEEMLNYFNLDYQSPPDSKLFNITSNISNCPWNAENQLLYIHFNSKKLNLDSLPPSNLVFLIDVSGSMDMPNRLPLLKSAFRLMVNNLRDKDSVAIVTYGGVTGVMLNTVSGAEKEKILKAIDEMEPGGNTPGESGIKLAYSVARNHFIKNGNNRVILATDGDFNVGLRTEDELDSLISKHQKSGIYLTCLGVGMGNYKDSKIQTLSKKGNGNFAYLDNFKEAEKVLMEEFTKTLYAVADNVYMNVDFNPEYVKEYRLIGFDNKVGALRDSLSVIEGGEIGSGHSMLALFEIVPTEINKGAIKDHYENGKLANIRLEYQLPGQSENLNDDFACKFNYQPFNKLSKACQFSAAVAMFGSVLRNSPFTRNVDWDQILTLAQNSSGSENSLQTEFIQLVQEAKNLYEKVKKRK